MIETSTSNEQNSSNPAQNVVDQDVENQRDLEELVELSRNTLALLNSDKNETMSHASDDEDESDKKERKEEPPQWRQSIFKVLGDNQSRLTHSESRRRPYIRRLQTNNSIDDIDEEQLAAPYVEEQQPEQPDYLKRSSETQSDTPLLAEERRSEAGGSTASSENRLRDSVKKALALHKIQNLFTAPKKEYLENAGNFSPLMFQISLSVPFLWARLDSRGRRAPPIIFEALKLAITDSYNDENSYNLQTAFRIELEYGDIKWIIERTAFDFFQLDLKLRKKKDLESKDIPSLPTGIIAWIGTLFHRSETRHAKQASLALERREQLQSYLIQLIRSLNIYVSYDLNEFLELSAISITRDMGWKGKEGYLENKVMKFRSPIFFWKRTSNESWEKEWILVRDSYIAFCSHISSTTPTDVFLIDKTFKCEKTRITGFQKFMSIHDHIDLSNSARKIELKGDKRTLDGLLKSVERVKKSSPWVLTHRFDSFAPRRKAAKVKWYVDGKDYFFAVSQAILAAKSEIYIEDWWLSPELYLRRPPSENEEFRLDRLLKKKAEEGVMIYIVVYKEVKYALTLDSNHTKQSLQSLHRNIRVQRHPDHGPEGTMFWAHHEKMVVVDSQIAFIGGLDLCFGRYDTHTHQMSDYHPDNSNSKPRTIWPGLDYSNPRVKDFINVKDWMNEIIDKKKTPRMPWHDVSVGMIGPPARDVARHFVQRWNFVKDEKAYGKEKFTFLVPKGEYVSTRDESLFKGTCDVQILRSSAEWSSGIQLENSIYNAYCHLIREAKHFIYIENQFFITSCDKSNNTIKNRIGECIVERVKRAHDNNEKFRIIVIMPLLPAFEADLSSKDAGTIRMVMHWQYISICRGGKSVLEKIKEAGIDAEDYVSFYALRGHDKIHQIHQIDSKGKQSGEHSKNDSFSDEQSHSFIDDRIGGEPAIPAGIKQMDQKQNFVTEEVYIHSKLMIVDDKFVICGSANLNDRSQLGNRDSEIAIVIEDKKYVTTLMNGKEYQAGKFAYTLRSYLFKEHLGLNEPQDHSTVTKSSLPPVSREILFDLLHERDSSLSSILDENKNYTQPKIHHPTKEDKVVMDPLSDDFYEHWKKTAKYNSETYRSVFRCIPDKNVTSWSEYKTFVPDPTKVPAGHVANSEISVEETRKKLDNIRGHLVEFPLEFLNKENLLGSVIQNAVTPAEIFT